MTTHVQELATALGHFQAGRLQEAEAACRQVLEQEPQQADALHLLGVLAQDEGDLDRAARLATENPYYNPRQVEYSGVHQLLEKQATPYPVLLTLFRRANSVIIASLRSRNGVARKIAEKLQGGGHANASGATLPRSIKTIPEAVNYLKQVLNPKKDAPLNSLESLFASLDMSQQR